MSVLISGSNDRGQLGNGATDTHASTLQKILLNPVGTQVKMVACGESFTVFVTSKNEIFTCGTNLFGNGENREYQSVEKPGFEKEEISHIACGAQHIVIAANEKLYSVGRNIYGQLGTGNLKSSTKFVPMVASLPAKTVKIACGDHFTMVLTEDGQLYSVGANKYGQLGLGHKTDTEVLQLVPFKHKIRDVACGHGFVLIVDEHGYVHACGRNHRGQLGIGHAQDQIKFVHVEVSAKILRVFCGREHSIFLSDRNTLFATGSNDYGQLGISLGYDQHKKPGYWSQYNILKSNAFTVEGIIAVCCTHANHTAIVSTSNRVYVAGQNDMGQCAVESSVQNKVLTFQEIQDVDIGMLGTEIITSVATGSHHTVFGAKRHPLAEQYAMLEVRFEILAEENHDLKKRIANILQENESLKSHVQSLLDQVSTLQSNLKEALDENQQLTIRVSTLECENTELKQIVAQLQVTVDRLKMEKEATVRELALEREKLALEKEKVKLEQEKHAIAMATNQQLTKANGKLEHDNQVLSKENQRLLQDIDQLAQDNQQLSLDNHRLLEDNQELVDDIDHIANDNQLLLQENDQLVSQVERLVLDNGQLSETVQHVQRENSKLSIDVEHFTNELNTTNVHVGQQNDQIHEQEEEITQLMIELSETTKRMHELEHYINRKREEKSAQTMNHGQGVSVQTEPVIEIPVKSPERDQGQTPSPRRFKEFVRVTETSISPRYRISPQDLYVTTTVNFE